jgi:hypothetical protein
MAQFYAYVHARAEAVDASAVFYVGKGCGKRSHDFSARNPYHGNVIGKYGEESILAGRFDCSTEKFALELEKGLIKTLKRMFVKLTNMTEGGEGVSGYSHTDSARKLMSAQRKGRTHAPETLEKMSLSRSGANNSFYGKHHSEETALKISEAKIGKPGPWLGKTRDALTRVKISKSLRGKPGRPHTEFSKAKISAAKIGVKRPPLSEETRKKLSESISANWAKRKQSQREK